MKSSPQHGYGDAGQARGARVASPNLRLVVPLDAAVGGGGDGGFPMERSPDGSANDQSLTVLAW